MRERRATAWMMRRRTAVGSALAGLLALVSTAAAQDDGSGSLGFLKPWIERQLFGRETSDPNEPAPSVAPTEGAPASIEPAPVPIPPQDQATGEPPTDGDAQAPPPDSETAAGLRGAVTPPVSQIGTPAPQTPPAGEVTTPPETETPGVPVEARPEALRFAVLAGRSISATMATIGPVADELQTILGRPVEILPLASYDAMIDAQAQRRVDGGFYSAAAFAAADTVCACLQPLVAPKAADGTLAYHAVIVARASSGIASIADLPGKTVAVGAADSIGARRLQLAGLLSEGIDPATTFGAVLAVDSADTAVRFVAAGIADAAFAWSSLAGGVERGYSRGTLTDLVAAGEIAVDKLTVVWSSPPITHGPFAVLRSLSEVDKNRITNYLLALSAGNPTAYDLLDPFYGGGFAPVASQDYAGLEALLAENVDALRLPISPQTTGATAAGPADASAVPSSPN